jgi:hypothetical protein
LSRLRGLGNQFNGAVGGMLGLVSCQSRPQCRELLVRFEPAEALGGLQHGGTGPAQRHRSVPPAFDVAANPPNGAHHVLNDVGAGERAAQLGRKAEADDGQDFVEALQQAAGNAGSLLLQPAGEVPDQPFGLVGGVQFPRLTQRLADRGMQGRVWYERPTE